MKQSKLALVKNTNKVLHDFKEAQELAKIAQKRVAELKAEIKEKIEAGVYGDMVLTFEEREVEEYTVPARVDILVKVTEIK